MSRHLYCSADDLGKYCRNLPRSSADLFETWVHRELRSYLDLQVRDGVVNYWRTQAGVEVDFVVGNTAIEVKSTANIL